MLPTVFQKNSTGKAFLLKTKCMFVHYIHNGRVCSVCERERGREREREQERVILGTKREDFFPFFFVPCFYFSYCAAHLARESSGARTGKTCPSGWYEWLHPVHIMCVSVCVRERESMCECGIRRVCVCVYLFRYRCCGRGLGRSDMK